MQRGSQLRLIPLWLHSHTVFLVCGPRSKCNRHGYDRTISEHVSIRWTEMLSSRKDLPKVMESTLTSGQQMEAAFRVAAGSSRLALDAFFTVSDDWSEA